MARTTSQLIAHPNSFNMETIKHAWLAPMNFKTLSMPCQLSSVLSVVDGVGIVIAHILEVIILTRTNTHTHTDISAFQVDYHGYVCQGL